MHNILNKVLGLTFLVVGVFLIVKNNQDLDVLRITLVLLMFILSFFFIFLPIINKNLIMKIPLFNLINFYFLVCYLGIFLFDKNEIFLNYYSVSHYSDSILILFLGYLFFLIGYFITNLIFKKKQRKGFEYLDCTENEILIFGIILLVSTTVIFYFMELQMYINSIAQIKYPSLLFGIGLCFHYILIKKNINNIILLILLLLLSLPIFLELLSGLFNFPFMIIFLIYIYYIIIKKKINLIPLFIIGLIFIFISIGKYDYRSKTWLNESNELSFFDKSKIFVNTYISKKSNDLKFNNIINRSDNYRLERRIFHSYWSLIIVTKETPSTIPHWNGYSYKILLSKIVPRIFWINKPSDDLGNEFGHRYNRLTKDTNKTKRDNLTSWNMPVLNEFYVNFGSFGVISGMTLIGILTSLFQKFFSNNKKNNIENIFAFYIFAPLFFLESHLSILFGALIQSLFFLFLISFIFLYFIRKFT